MKPLIVLVAVFLLSLGITKLTHNGADIELSGNIAMCIMLCFTALGHFKFTKGMEMMVPKPIPFKKELVYIAGILEIALGILLLFEDYRYEAGLVVIAFFLLLLPANIYAAANRVDYENATYNGKGLDYLWFRVPMQVFLILWVWYFSLVNYNVF